MNIFCWKDFFLATPVQMLESAIMILTTTNIVTSSWKTITSILLKNTKNIEALAWVSIHKNVILLGKSWMRSSMPQELTGEICLKSVLSRRLETTLTSPA